MAFIGMRHVVGAKFSEHTEGSEPTYVSGGKDLGGAISANLTINRANKPLYYDDAVGEEDNGINSIDIELGLDDLDEEIQEFMGLLEKKTAGTPAVTTYYETDGASDYIGFGYMRVRRRKGVTTYQGIWFYKVMFSRGTESAATKGESIEWQTPTVTGRSIPLNVDSDSERKYRKIQNFSGASGETDCASWLDSLAGITRT